MRLTTPQGIIASPFRSQGELCLWLLKKCYPCLRYTCYLCLRSIHPLSKGGDTVGSAFPKFRGNIHYHLRSPLTMKAGPKGEARGRRRRAGIPVLGVT